MKIELSKQNVTSGRQHAFTLMEVMLAVVIIGIEFTGLYVGMTQGFAVVQVARENLRATQILQEKMETIRLYTWDQITDSATPFIPRTFTASFYPDQAGGTNNQGVLYSGTTTVANTAMTESYKDNFKQVTVNVSWTSGNINRQRQMTTLVSRYGLHNYIYN